MTKQLADLEQTLDDLSGLECSRWIPEAGHFGSFQPLIRQTLDIGFNLKLSAYAARIRKLLPNTSKYLPIMMTQRSRRVCCPHPRTSERLGCCVQNCKKTKPTRLMKPRLGG